MSYTTLVELNIAILGPSDISPTVPKIEERIAEYEKYWNAIQPNKQIRLTTRRYDREIPSFHPGWDGQTFVDKGLLTQANIVIVMFNKTPGTPYKDPNTHKMYVSTTDYEIMRLTERYKKEGKPAIHVFFPKSYTSEMGELLRYRNELSASGSGFMIGEWNSKGNENSDKELGDIIRALLQEDVTSILCKQLSPSPITDDWVGRARDILVGLSGVDGNPGELIAQPAAVKSLNDGGVNWRELRFDKASEMICELKKRGVIEFDGEKGGQPTIRVVGISGRKLSDDWVGRARDILVGLSGVDGNPGELIAQPAAVKSLNDGGVNWRELRFDKASEMICELKKRGVIEFDGEKGGQPTIRVISVPESKEPAIRRFAYLNWDVALPRVAKLALPEMWGFNSDSDDFGILRNYLTYTFERANLEKKILFTSDNTIATFNTGLISRKGNDIYMTFEPNEHPYLKWRFRRFEEIPYGRGLLGDSLSDLPEHPSYGKESDFRFDTNLEIRISIDKIIQSALNRLPKAYLREIAEHNDDLLYELDSRNPDWKVISEIVALDRTISRYLEMDFNMARDNVRAMARANSHLPIPFYYPKDKKIEFLLPFDLDWDPMDWNIGEKTKMHPQAVLVLERQQRNNDEYYQVHGLLDLRMAYIDARLLGRQDDTWLDPEAIFGKR